MRSEMDWKVLLTQPIHESGIALLRMHADVKIFNFETDTSQKIIAKHVGDVDAIITRTPRIGGEVIRKAERLKVIGKHGAGYDNVDVKTATDRGIPVVYTPHSPAESVATHVIGLMIALAKGIVIADRKLRDDTSEGWKFRYLFTGDTLKDKILGLIGLGRIGSSVAKLAKGFDMRIIYYDVVRKKDLEQHLGVEYASLTDLLKISDFVSISVPLTERTRGMIGEEELSLMKKGSYLINTARGRIVDEKSLFKFLKDRRLAGAALDVYSTEPISPSNPLLKLENVILTPHMAAHTKDYFEKAAKTVVEDVLRVLRGEKPLHVANPEVYGE